MNSDHAGRHVCIDCGSDAIRRFYIYDNRGNPVVLPHEMYKTFASAHDDNTSAFSRISVGAPESMDRLWPTYQTKINACLDRLANDIISYTDEIIQRPDDFTLDVKEIVQRLGGDLVQRLRMSLNVDNHSDGNVKTDKTVWKDLKDYQSISNTVTIYTGEVCSGEPIEDPDYDEHINHITQSLLVGTGDESSSSSSSNRKRNNSGIFDPTVQPTDTSRWFHPVDLVWGSHLVPGSIDTWYVFNDSGQFRLYHKTSILNMLRRTVQSNPRLPKTIFADPTTREAVIVHRRARSLEDALQIVKDVLNSTMFLDPYKRPCIESITSYARRDTANVGQMQWVWISGAPVPTFTNTGTTVMYYPNVLSRYIDQAQEHIVQNVLHAFILLLFDPQRRILPDSFYLFTLLQQRHAASDMSVLSRLYQVVEDRDTLRFMTSMLFALDGTALVGRELLENIVTVRYSDGMLMPAVFYNHVNDYETILLFTHAFAGPDGILKTMGIERTSKFMATEMNQQQHRTIAEAFYFTRTEVDLDEYPDTDVIETFSAALLGSTSIERLVDAGTVVKIITDAINRNVNILGHIFDCIYSEDSNIITMVVDVLFGPPDRRLPFSIDVLGKILLLDRYNDISSLVECVLKSEATNAIEKFISAIFSPTDTRIVFPVDVITRLLTARDIHGTHGTTFLADIFSLCGPSTWHDASDVNSILNIVVSGLVGPVERRLDIARDVFDTFLTIQVQLDPNNENNENNRWLAYHILQDYSNDNRYNFAGWTLLHSFYILVKEPQLLRAMTNALFGPLVRSACTVQTRSMVQSTLHEFASESALRQILAIEISFPDSIDESFSTNITGTLKDLVRHHVTDTKVLAVFDAL